MRVHCNAATTACIRSKIQRADGSVREIARRFGVSPSTVHKWRGRDSVEDGSSRPRRLRTAFDEETEALLLDLRRRGLSLDEVFETVMDSMPRLCRSSLWRLFRRHGLGRLKRPERSVPGQFKPYPPGVPGKKTLPTPPKRNFGQGSPGQRSKASGADKATGPVTTGQDG